MWYTSPWFIIGCGLLLIIAVFFLWILWFAKQLCKVIDLFYTGLIAAIPTDNSSFNFNMELKSADYKIVRSLCKLDFTVSTTQPNKVRADLSDMLATAFKKVDELKSYNVFYDVEVLKSKIIFRAVCDSKSQLEGIE